MNRPSCRIVIGPDDTRAYVPYNAKEIVKLMPVRHWSKALRCWILPVPAADRLQQLLEADGREVSVLRLKPIQVVTPQAMPGSGLAAARAAAKAAAEKSRQSAGRTESAA